MRIRIATRKSALALWQAEHVAGRLRLEEEVEEVVLVPLSTRGDEVLDRSLQKIGGKGLFIKELELAMQAGDADIAVHSMKDVPAEMPAGFRIAAVLERGSPFDALVTGNGRTLAELPAGAVIGSSSLRRQAQLLALRPDFTVEALRGNVNTRLRKLEEGRFDAIILACAGLERLGLATHISERISSDAMLPAAAQGVIGIECASARRDLAELLARLEHGMTRETTFAERAVARRLQASCHSPVASYAVIDGRDVRLRALVASADGRRVLRHEACAPIGEADRLGDEVATALLALGAKELLRQAANP
jgi:hydroxymethylbilane synthase